MTNDQFLFFSVLSLFFVVNLSLANQTKKASGRSPTGHDYRQPKVEEGADAFCRSG
jgi:hypothetical protein